MKNKSFLDFVAEDLIRKFGADLSQVVVVFPNKRAALFLNDSLARVAGRPIWSPSYMTISDLFRKHSHLMVADPIKLVCDLHKVFVSATGKQESLDQFYGWGQLLLSDFDDVDKNMADAEKVFANIRDIHELDSVSYLNEEQKALLSKFFVNFTPDHESVLKESFLTLWSNLGRIYSLFNEHLAEQGLAYEGALYRKVAESSEINFHYTHYVFVGFNMLHQVEQRLFSRLKQEGRAYFYWDFDKSYMNENSESSYYIRQYLSTFPNELDMTDDAIYHHLNQKKDITYISAPTENVQARYVSQWLCETGKGRIEAGRDTAIVLCDENLLQVVVHCLPPEVGKVNITTGYPLSKSPFASLVNVLIAMQAEGRAKTEGRFRLQFVQRVLRHPYASEFIVQSKELLDQLEENHVYHPGQEDLVTDEATALVFQQLPKDDILSLTQWLTDILNLIGIHAGDHEDSFYQESLFRTYTLVNRLHELIRCGDLDVDTTTLCRLFNQLVSTTSVPFHGEPAEGLQIMGVLETRNLDFSHVLVLSCNEGNMPKGLNDASFIPYSIRKAYGLTTIDNKVAIYSYYFHSLLQRATDVTLLYNHSTEDGNRGEMSRFMLQLLVERQHHDIRRCSLQAPNVIVPPMCSSVAKDQKVLEKLNAMTRLSPTDLANYMRCPLIFYYQKVEGLRELQEEDGNLDGRVFGNIFHKAAQLAYEKLCQKGQIVQKGDIEAFLKDPRQVSDAVDQAFREELFGDRVSRSEDDYNGLQIINRRVMIEYLSQLLSIDKELAPFRILGLEKWVDQPFTVKYHPQPIIVGGIIDRLDAVAGDNGEDRIRVVDYKTGGKPRQNVNDIQSIFDSSSMRKTHAEYYLQTMLYSSIVRHHSELNNDELPVSPALFFIQYASGEGYDPTLKVGGQTITDIEPIQNEFLKGVLALMEEIFNPAQPFKPTDDRSRCELCAFRKLCMT